MSDSHGWVSHLPSYIIVNNCFITRERMRNRWDNSFSIAWTRWGKVNNKVGDICEAAKTELTIHYETFNSNLIRLITASSPHIHTNELIASIKDFKASWSKFSLRFFRPFNFLKDRIWYRYAISRDF
jgi:hypothetical protein